MQQIICLEDEKEIKTLWLFQNAIKKNFKTQAFP